MYNHTMPLIKSGSKAAISENISEMVHAGHPQNQAVAAALRNARQYGGKAAGGGVQMPFGERMAARNLNHEGFLHSAVPGRTDKLPISVSGGSYVLPADHVAAIGQGNSLAGANIVNKMFKMGPYGSMASSHGKIGAKVPKLSMKAKMAKGGSAHAGKPTDIIAAGGEIVIPDHKIIEKFGDLHHGHKALDHWVVSTRKKHIKTLKKLKPPRED
jgi:hypothetical protein